MKRIVYAFFALIFLIFSVIIPDFSSFATDVTIEGTVGDLLYGYTSQDILSVYNYNDYYDTVSDELKECVNPYIYMYNYNSDFGQNFATNIANQVGVDNSNFSQLVFPDQTGYKVIFANYYRSTSSPHIVLGVISGGSDLAIVNGFIYSTTSFQMYLNSYNTNDGGLTFVDDQEPVTVNATYEEGFQRYYIDYSNQYNMWIYSDLPFYFKFVSNENYPNYDLTSYNYDITSGIYEAVVSGDDETGFVVDRRPEHMINPSGGGSGMNDIVTLDYDPTLFNGVLGFNWFNPSCTLNYNQHTSSYFPYYIVKYQINNYTDIHKTECSLIIDADIALKLSVNDPNNDYDGSGAYSSISHYHFNNELLLNNNLDGFTLFATSNSNSWTNTSLRTARGFNTATHLIPFNGDLTSDINNIIAQWNTTGSIDKLNSYGVFRLNFYVRNNVTGAVSETFTAEFNLLTNQYTDNRNDIISNDNQEFIDFKNSFDYQDNNGDYLPVNYADYVYGSSGGSVGDITIQNPQYPYVLVDIPENEWIDATPNLKSILNTYKDMLQSTQDDSILNMLPATYSYFPQPVWEYLLYGVGICVAIGIWRGITRR